jgi:D-alanyl-D-alanine carboxypeptidase
MQYGPGVYRVPDPCSSPEDPTWLYGHDDAAFGTISIALNSSDGERQSSLGVAGRNMTSGPEALYDLNDVLVPMLLTTAEAGHRE